MDRKNLILIVDDEPINITIAAKMLEKAGYLTIQTYKSTEAFDIAKKEKPDLILLDIMMPELDGFDVCKQILSDKGTKDIPIIFLTALYDKKNIVKGLNCGGRDYLSKPFHKEELLARINTHIQLKNALEKQKKLIDELTGALEKINTLSGLLPICSHCKKIRDDQGYWQKVEFYIQANSECEFSHSICPDCIEKYYPKIAEKIRKRKEEENKAQSK